jgi:hypothetical protein
MTRLNNDTILIISTEDPFVVCKKLRKYFDNIFLLLFSSHYVI